MRKRNLLPLFLTVGLLFSAQAESLLNKLGLSKITMLVVPRAEEPVRIAMDISQSYPTLIVCYQQSHNLLNLHAWNGTQWVKVSTEDYQQGTFFTNAPSEAVIIEPEGVAASDILTPPESWCEKTYRLRTTDLDAVIYLLGRHLDFPYSLWIEFAERYDRTLEQINPSHTNVPWWHYRGNQLISKDNPLDHKIHKDKWISPDAPIKPAEPKPVVKMPEPEPVAKSGGFKTAPRKEPTPAVDVIVKELTETPAPTPAPAPVKKEPVVKKPAKPEPILIKIPAEAAPVKPATEAAKTEPAEKEFDPFTADQVPAAEVILP
jgi:hypothetical protein